MFDTTSTLITGYGCNSLLVQDPEITDSLKQIMHLPQICQLYIMITILESKYLRLDFSAIRDFVIQLIQKAGGT